MQSRRKLPQYWRRFGWASLGIACIGAAILAFAPAFSGLFWFALYSMPSNSLLPLPHEPGLLYAAQYYSPWAVALAGTVGTIFAACVDYPVVQRAFRHPKLQQARHTRLYQVAVRWLMRYPFATVVVFAATPLPVYVVRVLAPASGYPLWRYTLATAIGRYPRYFLVALLGHLFHIPGWALVALFCAMVAAMVWAARETRGEAIDGLEVLEASGASKLCLRDQEAELLGVNEPTA